jgi:ubiquinone/menaquinone biosynthesis C-methylase UbiE
VQYLDDGELERALAELRRVVRPGGVVAVKDLDASLVTVRPGDPFRFAESSRRARPPRAGGWPRPVTTPTRWRTFSDSQAPIMVLAERGHARTRFARFTL